MPIVRVPVRIDYPVEGGPGANILHVRTTDSNQETWELPSALNALATFYQEIAENYPSGTTITIGEGMVVDPTTAPAYVDDDVKIINGSGGAPPAPALLSLCVSWRTSSATRSGRGRTFLGPIHKDALDSTGTVEVSVLNRTRAAVNGLVADSQTLNGWSLGVLSTKQGVLRDVTGGTVRDRFAYLSSRRD
jgi:hypothetical protein